MLLPAERLRGDSKIPLRVVNEVYNYRPRHALRAHGEGWFTPGEAGVTEQRPRRLSLVLGRGSSNQLWAGGLENTQDRKGVLSEATQILLEGQKGREQGLNGWSAGPGRGHQRWTDYWENAVGTSSREKTEARTQLETNLGGGGGDSGMAMLSGCCKNPNKRQQNAILLIYLLWQVTHHLLNACAHRGGSQAKEERSADCLCPVKFTMKSNF